MKVRIGRVRTNSGLVVHLSIGGDPCACGHKVNADAGRHAATARLCKRGFTTARIARAQQLNNSAGARWSAVVDTILADITTAGRPNRLAEKIADPTQWETDDQFAARLAAECGQPTPAPAPRSWAAIRADFAQTHRPAARQAA